MASLAVCATGSALLLAFSLTACSDPGIVYRSVEGFPANRSAVTDAALSARSMERGGVLCGMLRVWVERRKHSLKCWLAEARLSWGVKTPGRGMCT